MQIEIPVTNLAEAWKTLEAALVREVLATSRHLDEAALRLGIHRRRLVTLAQRHAPGALEALVLVGFAAGLDGTQGPVFVGREPPRVPRWLRRRRGGGRRAPAAVHRIDLQDEDTNRIPDEGASAS